jgi:CBS-domain-containing membrane protein
MVSVASSESSDAQDRVLGSAPGAVALDASRTLTAATADRRRVADAMITCPVTYGPESPAEKIRVFFRDDHRHMALIVAPDGQLITTIERPDLAAATPSSAPVAKLGTLIGRTAGPADPLAAATAALLREGRRRLAVVDDSGRLLGLLCLKKDGTGYCSDEDIRERGQRVPPLFVSAE